MRGVADKVGQIVRFRSDVEKEGVNFASDFRIRAMGGKPGGSFGGRKVGGFGEQALDLLPKVGTGGRVEPPPGRIARCWAGCDGNDSKLQSVPDTGGIRQTLLGSETLRGNQTAAVEENYRARRQGENDGAGFWGRSGGAQTL